MGYHSIRGYYWAIAGMVILSLSNCTADEPSGPDLDKILIREKAQSLAAAKIGKAGGLLQITEGEYAGTMLDVPPGSLRGDAVISIYAGTPVEEDDGFRPVGPAIRLMATVSALRADAILTLPFSAERVSEPAVTSLVFMRLTGDQLSAVAGAAYFDTFARAAIREFNEYSIALDLAVLPVDPITENEPPRCPLLGGGKSMQDAIAASRSTAFFTLPSTEQVLKARSFGANGCGYSLGWEVVWFSVIGNAQATVEVWPNGVSFPVSASKPPCATTANAFKGSANSTVLSNDMAERLGATPSNLQVSIVACDSPVPADPPRVRLEDSDSGNFVEYNADGTFYQKNF